MSYRLLHVLSFCHQERLFLFIFKIEVSVVLQTTWKDYQLIKYLELVCQLGPGTFEKLWMDITKFCCQPFCFSCANHGFLMVSSPWSCSLGRLSDGDGDGNENGKKAIGLISKTTTLHVHHAFLYILLSSLHDCDVKMQHSVALFATMLQRCVTLKIVVANRLVMGNANKRRRIFRSLSKLESSPQEINYREIRLYFTFSVNWNKRDKVWIKAHSFEKWRFRRRRRC